MLAPSGRVRTLPDRKKLLTWNSFLTPHFASRVDSFVVQSNLAVVSYHNAKLSVATDRLSTLMTGGFAQSALFQFLGELQVRRGEVREAF